MLNGTYRNSFREEAKRKYLERMLWRRAKVPVGTVPEVALLEMKNNEYSETSLQGRRLEQYQFTNTPSTYSHPNSFLVAPNDPNSPGGSNTSSSGPSSRRTSSHRSDSSSSGRSSRTSSHRSHSGRSHTSNTPHPARPPTPTRRRRRRRRGSHGAFMEPLFTTQCGGETIFL